MSINRELDALWIDEVYFFAERMDQSESGRIIVKSSLIEKYRRMTGDYSSENTEIKNHLIDTMNALDIPI